VEAECNWICENKGLFIGLIVAIVLIVIILTITIWRLSRYVGKYKE